MPGYVIHLAIAKKHIEINGIKNAEKFIKGTIDPDILKQQGIDSHYGYSNNPNFKEFFEEHSLQTDYNRGYFLHLATDYLFYNKFLDKWDPSIYEDYSILNRRLVERYGIEIPEEIKKDAEFKEGKLSILEYDSVIEFIETTAKIPLEEIIKRKLISLQEVDRI